VRYFTSLRNALTNYHHLKFNTFQHKFSTHFLSRLQMTLKMSNNYSVHNTLIRDLNSLKSPCVRHCLEILLESRISYLPDKIKAVGQFKSLPLWPPNAVSYGCIVQCLCSSLVFVLHFLMLMLNFTLFYDQCIQSILEGHRLALVES